LLDQSGAHAPDHGNLPLAVRRPRQRRSVLIRLCARHPPRTKGRTGTQARG
jgi:hypothetical protein